MLLKEHLGLFPAVQLGELVFRAKEGQGERAVLMEMRREAKARTEKNGRQAIRSVELSRED